MISKFVELLNEKKKKIRELKGKEEKRKKKRKPFHSIYLETLKRGGGGKNFTIPNMTEESIEQTMYVSRNRDQSPLGSLIYSDIFFLVHNQNLKQENH